LIGFQDVCKDAPENFCLNSISYFKLSENRLEYHWRDQPEVLEAEE